MKTTATSTSVRPKRTPIGSRNVLSVKGMDENYHYRIVNDTGDRIAMFQDAGYELVDAKDVAIGDKRVNSATPEGTKAQVSVGEGRKGFLMRIPKQYHEEDQAAKQAKVDALEQSVKNQMASGKVDYGSIKIERDK